jgi:hypothetical protein
MAFLPPGARKTPLMAQITADIPAVGLQNTRLLNDVTAAGLRDALVDQEHALVGIWSAEGNVLRQAGTTGIGVGITRVSHGIRLRPPQKNMIAIPNDFAWW